MKGEIRVTQSGPVLTKTTELATVVYSRELIQAAKCKARNRPDNTVRRNCDRAKTKISTRWRVRAMGARIRLAIPIRNEAITREGASAWANRMRIEAEETARMAITRASVGFKERLAMLKVGNLDLVQESFSLTVATLRGCKPPKV